MTFSSSYLVELFPSRDCTKSGHSDPNPNHSDFGDDFREPTHFEGYFIQEPSLFLCAMQQLADESVVHECEFG